jgi:hypothetical protein
VQEDTFHDIVAVEVIEGFLLRFTFDDASQQVVDFEPLLYGPVFGPLRDIELFRQVRVNNETGTIGWSNGADFSPSVLYDWPVYRDRVLWIPPGSARKSAIGMVLNN